MKKYTTLFIDLDDTLIDKNASIYYAYKEMMALDIIDLPYNQKEAEAFLKFDTNYWREQEKNGWIVPAGYQTTKEQEVYYLRTERFIRFFEEVLKITTHEYPLTRENAAIINEKYMEALGNYALPVEGAKTFLKKIPKNVFVIVSTNGGQQAAEKRLELAGLKSYVDQVVSSEKVGCSKPSRKFFETILEKYPHINSNEILVIGDDLTTDIKGAQKMGFDSCWFNYKKEFYSELPENVYEVENLEDILYAFLPSEEYPNHHGLKEISEFSKKLQQSKVKKINHR